MNKLTDICENFIITDHETGLYYVLYDTTSLEIYDYIKLNDSLEFKPEKDKLIIYNNEAFQEIAKEVLKYMYYVKMEYKNYKNNFVIKDDLLHIEDKFEFEIMENYLHIENINGKYFDVYYDSKGLELLHVQEHEANEDCIIKEYHKNEIICEISIRKEIYTHKEQSIEDKLDNTLENIKISPLNESQNDHDGTPVSISESKSESAEIQPSFILSGNQEYYFPCPELSPLEIDPEYILTSHDRVLRLFLSGYPQKLQYNISLKDIEENSYAKNIALYCHFRAIPIKNIENDEELKVKLDVPTLEFVLDFDRKILDNEIPPISHMTEVEDIMIALEIVIATKELYKFYMGEYLWIKYGKWLRERLSGSELVYKIDQIDIKYKIYSIEDVYKEMQFIELKKVENSFENIVNKENIE